VTLPFVDEREFLTMTQLVLTLLLPLQEATADPLHAAADPTTVESTTEPPHAAVDPTAVGATLTETTSLCVWV
jgi:hypothetical protein